MLTTGTVINKIKIIKELKHGAQGFVYLGEDVVTREQVVLKSVFIEESKKPECEKVFRTWKSLSESKARQFIVEYRSHFEEGKNTMMVMEYCSGGDLETLIKKKQAEHLNFDESFVLKVLVDGMSALNEMKILNFIHRDIKSANMFIGSDGKIKIGKIKISDFNSSKVMEGSVRAAIDEGTLEFTAPEVVNSKEYSHPVDVFSLGSVLYQMMVGRTPFVNARGLVMKNLSAGKYEPIPHTLGYSAQLVDLVHACLQLNPAKRPIPAEVLVSPLAATAVATEAAHEVERMRATIAALEERVAEQERRAERLKREQEAKMAEMKREQEAKIAEVKREQEEKTELKIAEMRKIHSAQIEAVKKDIAQLMLAKGGTINTLPLAVKYMANSQSGFTVTKDGAEVTFAKNGTLFLDHNLNDGIYKLKMVLEGFSKDPYTFVGLCDAKDIATVMECGFMGNWGCQKLCAYIFLCKRGSCLRIRDQKTDDLSEFPAFDGVSVTVEVNADEKTMHFFHNETLFPFAVRKIPASAVLGFSVGICPGETATMKFISFEKSAVSSVDSSAPCAYTDWQEQA